MFNTALFVLIESQMEQQILERMEKKNSITEGNIWKCAMFIVYHTAQQPPHYPFHRYIYENNSRSR